MPDVPSLALGTGLVTPLSLTAAYAPFANGGLAVRPRDLVRVVDADGSAAFATDPETEAVLSPAVAYQMTSMLGDVVDRGTGTAARRLGVTFPVGGKTGTTDDFKDAWFVGYSSSIVVGVWVGFDQPKTIAADAYGARYALPIWADFMRRAAQGAAGRRLRSPGGAARRGAVRGVVSASGRRLPDLHRVLQGRRRRAEPAVHDPSRQHQAAADAHRSGLGRGDRAPRPRYLPVSRPSFSSIPCRRTSRRRAARRSFDPCGRSGTPGSWREPRGP